MSEPQPMPPRLFVTELARLTESPAWPLLLPWFKQRCAERVLEARFAEEMDRARQSLAAAGELILAIENEVQKNRGILDGRKTRHEINKAAVKAAGVAGGSRPRTDKAAGPGGAR